MSKDYEELINLYEQYKYRCGRTDLDGYIAYAKMQLEKGNKDKPPLGLKPCYIQAEQRIKDLADAISRYADRGDYEIIKKWAREICLQCEIARMEK